MPSNQLTSGGVDTPSDGQFRVLVLLSSSTYNSGGRLQNRTATANMEHLTVVAVLGEDVQENLVLVRDKMCMVRNSSLARCVLRRFVGRRRVVPSGERKSRVSRPHFVVFSPEIQNVARGCKKCRPLFSFAHDTRSFYSTGNHSPPPRPTRACAFCCLRRQDQVPVPLVCGKFTTEYEADRAAEAFSSPVWHEPSPNSR